MKCFCLFATLTFSLNFSILETAKTGMCKVTEQVTHYKSQLERYIEYQPRKLCWRKVFAGIKCPDKKVHKTRYINVPIVRNVVREKCCQGYQQILGNCQPVCSESCQNGVCVGPEECQCNYGYIKFSAYRCIPRCSNCDFGQCVSPGICVCSSGYTEQNNSCVPTCDFCTGNCVAPNVCITSTTEAISTETFEFTADIGTQRTTEAPSQIQSTITSVNEEDKVTTDTGITEDTSIPFSSTLTEFDTFSDQRTTETSSQAQSISTSVNEEDKVTIDTGITEDTSTPFSSTLTEFDTFSDQRTTETSSQAQSISTSFDEEKVTTDTGMTRDTSPHFSSTLTDFDTFSHYQKCENDCIRGVCVGNSTCFCDDGFTLTSENNFTCYADMNCEDCLAIGLACFPSCYETLYSTTRTNLEVTSEETEFVTEDLIGKKSFSAENFSNDLIWIYMSVVASLLITLTIILVVFHQKYQKIIEYDVGQLEHSAKCVYFLKENGIQEENL